MGQPLELIPEGAPSGSYGGPTYLLAWWLHSNQKNRHPPAPHTWTRRPGLPFACEDAAAKLSWPASRSAGSRTPRPCCRVRASQPLPPLLCRCRLYFAGAASPSATSSHSSSSPPSPSPLSSSESLRLALRSCVMSLRTCQGGAVALIRANAHQLQLVAGRPIR